jgi:hypothetical protein
MFVCGMILLSESGCPGLKDLQDFSLCHFSGHLKIKKKLKN